MNEGSSSYLALNKRLSFTRSFIHSFSKYDLSDHCMRGPVQTLLCDELRPSPGMEERSQCDSALQEADTKSRLNMQGEMPA